ncbi:hypothetical protein LXL04_018243 [Taraxacum kok-saghyz]
MESAKPSSSAPPYPGGGAGAGGKFRKPPISRKRPSTPYDRPSLTTGNNKPGDSQDSGGGWLSKLVVNPARRLIVGGATRILPSFFSKSDSSSTDEYEDDPSSDDDDQEVGATEIPRTDANHTMEASFLILFSRDMWSGAAGPSNETDKLKGSLVKSLQQDEPKKSPGDHGLTEIENMLKGKQFSRDERNRLMEILNSRMIDVSNTEDPKKSPPVISHGKAKEVHTIGKQYNTESTVLETPMPNSQSNMQDEVTASPIDIARAYMGNRTSEKLGFNTYSIKSKDEREHQEIDPIPSKPHFLTPSSKPSTCWPGAMVQEPRGYLTPQIQRTRYGLHNLPRTPYSRTIYSSTKPKLNQLQGNNIKPSNPPLTTFQQSRTPNYAQVKSSGDAMDGGYGSVGPIRRVRNKFLSEPQSESRPSGSRSFMPVFQKNPEASSTTTIREHEQTYKGEATPNGPSSETVRKIMEKLDRHKPTPKEKAEELKLATQWKKPSSENNNLVPNESSVFGNLIGRDSIDYKSFIVGGGISKADEDSTYATIKGPEKTQPWISDNQINGQDSNKKKTLKPISFKRPDPQQVISSDPSRGFTFPFSATASSASEPPTPSIMPSFPAIGVGVPSYSFGTKKSERVVFSFPSTSSGYVDDGESDIKFKFGSDKKRVNFASIGTTDAIAIN